MKIGPYELDSIVQGDCLELMKALPDKSIDLVVTSPPYDNLRDYKGYSFAFNDISKELFRVIDDGGVLIWIVRDGTDNGSETGTSFKQALYFKEIGFNIHDTMIWYKDSFSFPHPTHYRDCFEYMFCLSKGRPKTINLLADRKNKWAGTRVHGTSRNTDGSTFRKSNHNKSNVSENGVRFNIWEIPSEKNNVCGHPAPFPERIAKDHILSWSNEGDVILDPMCGSGTTCKMAKHSNRKFIGFDISPDYVAMANRRLLQEVLSCMN